MTSAVEHINNKFDQAEEIICDRLFEIIWSEENQEKRM